jgi:hypothetical protein
LELARQSDACVHGYRGTPGRRRARWPDRLCPPPPASPWSVIARMLGVDVHGDRLGSVLLARPAPDMRAIHVEPHAVDVTDHASDLTAQRRRCDRNRGRVPCQDQGSQPVLFRERGHGGYLIRSRAYSNPRARSISRRADCNAVLICEKVCPNLQFDIESRIWWCRFGATGRCRYARSTSGVPG